MPPAPACRRRRKSRRTSPHASPRFTRSLTASTTAGSRGSVAEVSELDRQGGHRLPHQLDRRLQVVLLAARDPYPFTLDRGGDLDLGFLDPFLCQPAFLLLDT